MQTQLLVPAEVLRAHLPRELIVDYDLCPDCFEPLIELPTGVKICRKCGGEYNDGAQIEFDRIPLPEKEEKAYFEGHWNTGNSLSFNGALGTTQLVKQRLICRILSRKNGDNRDLGLRARQIKILVEHDEPETLRRALQRGSEALKAFGFEKNMMVGNTVGQYIRKLYAYLALTKTEHFNSRWTADCCVFYTLRYKFFYEPTPKEKIEHGFVVTQILKFPEAYLRILRLLDSV
jgi:hypothetical protein